MHKISVWNGAGINYITLDEDVIYFSHKPECFSLHNLSILFSNSYALKS
jgi:hypothetical protein